MNRLLRSREVADSITKKNKNIFVPSLSSPGWIERTKYVSKKSQNGNSLSYSRENYRIDGNKCWNYSCMYIYCIFYINCCACQSK